MAAEPTLVQIRERSFVEILDLALLVVRERPWELGIAALVGVLPFAALNTFILSDPEVTFPILLILLALEAPWATAPLTIVLGGMMFGVRPKVRTVAGKLVRALPAMIVYHGLLRVILVLPVITFPLIPWYLSFVNEVALLEQGSIGKIWGRSSMLSRSIGSDSFGRWVIQVIAGVAFAICFWVGTGAIFNALTQSQPTWDEPVAEDLVGLRLQFAAWLSIAFFAVVRLLTYLDQRIKLEGWELTNRHKALAIAMREAG